jgi:DNA-binding MarR family transcriptional regulator/GNAT superfamily N-acetyltransferase
MDTAPPPEHVDAVRGFNRFYTNVIGVLSEHLLDSPYTLAEVRVLFELAHRDGSDATELRGALGIDAGYLSRILARLSGDGLVAREPSPQDRRRRLLALTAEGRQVFDDLDARSDRQIAGLLAGLDPAGRREVAASMRRIRALLGDPDPASKPVLRELRPGDLGWIVYSQGRGYAEQLGWDASYEALVARIAADYAADRDPECEAGWIAELDGEPVGSIVCVRADETTAKLRLLWVEPAARGKGVGAMLVRRCVGFARERGYASMTLWTVSVLESARRLYEAEGFALAAAEPVRMFGRDDLVGQVWDLDLRAGAQG